MEGFEERIVPTPVITASWVANAKEDTGFSGTNGSVRFSIDTPQSTPLFIGITRSGTAGISDIGGISAPMLAAYASYVDVPIVPQHNSTATGTLTVILTVATDPFNNYTVGSPSTATVNVYDIDNTQVTVAKQGSDPTEGGNGTWRITRTGSTSGNLTVNYTGGGTATSGTDYTSIGTSATITSGNSYVDVTVATLTDNVVESGGETATITITDGGSSYTALPTATASMTITDDPPIVTIAATDTAEDANGKFRISRTGGKISDALTVNYTVSGGTADSGDDFTAVSGSVTIGATASYADVTVAALADNLIEGDETLEVTITSGSYTITSGTATLTITDDPPVFSVSRLADGTEGGNNGTFRVSRTGGDISDAFVVTYTVGGTASSASNVDFTALSGTITISASAAYADGTITVTNDGTSEAAETVILTLDTDGDWLNGSPTDTLFIWDNDAATFHWTGAEDDTWMNVDNWAENDIPGATDVVIFGGVYIGDVTLSGPLSLYTIGELHIASGYTGTIALSFPLTVGSLQMAGGTIDQPYSGYGSDLTVTGAALWTGGTLNSTANLANVIFDAATVLIAPASAGTIFAGSNINLENVASGTMLAGTIEVSNGSVVFSTSSGSSLAFNPGALGQAIIIGALSVPPAESFIEAGTSWTLYSGAVTFGFTIANAGTVTLWPNTTFVVVGDETTHEGYVQWGQFSETLLHGGSVLATPEQVLIQGGTLATVYSEFANSSTAIIVGSTVEFSGGDIYVGTQQSVHAEFGELVVDGNFLWSGGTFHPYVRLGGNNDALRQINGVAMGTDFRITAGTVAPIYLDSDYGTSSSPTTGHSWGVLKAGGMLGGGFADNTAPSVGNSWQMEVDDEDDPRVWSVVVN